MKCIDLHKHISPRILWACYHIRQMSLSGFKGARDRCFPHISKETFCWLFALIIFIRILLGSNTCHWSLTGRKTKVKRISLRIFFFLRWMSQVSEDCCFNNGFIKQKCLVPTWRMQTSKCSINSLLRVLYVRTL